MLKDDCKRINVANIATSMAGGYFLQMANKATPEKYRGRLGIYVNKYLYQ